VKYRTKCIAGFRFCSALRSSLLALPLLVSAQALSVAQPVATPPAEICGEVIAVATHNGTTTRYAVAHKEAAAPRAGSIALVLLVGGGGVLDLDDAGCPRALNRNVLIRMRPLFYDAGLVIALVDAPSDVHGEDGLAGFRTATQHAADLGKVIADLRARTHGQVWLVGHSRGTISAANAAARLSGASAPDGLVLLSAMISGDVSRRKPFVAQTVFDSSLEAIAVPVLVIGHESDNCLRSPARLMGTITARIRGARQQAVAVTAGPVKPGRAPNIADCGVGEPHDYVNQEAEVAAGILRFIGGGGY
jgi:hypothetical protein